MLEGQKRLSLRLWPGVALAALLCLLHFGAPVVDPNNGAIIGLLGSLTCGLLALLWWGFFSRARRVERLAAIVLAVVLPAGIHPFLHPSIRTGMMGMMYAIYLVPVLGVGLVAWAVATRKLEGATRLVTMAATLLMACGGWLLVRTEGVTSAGVEAFLWRWSPTPEERLLASAAPVPVAPAAPTATRTPAPEADSEHEIAPAPEEPAVEEPVPAAEKPAWPGFRGPERDSAVRGVRIATDWDARPPKELWRRPVGPGWSSFAVLGDAFYTQEQRGEEEIVACYRVETGEPIWMHVDQARFWEANAGAGPRATPTLYEGRVYALGATGLLNALEAKTGRLVWSRDAAADLEQETPGWGFAGSPLVLGDLVIVALSGRLGSYDRGTGEPVWQGPDGGQGYSSPHRAVIDGVEQVLLTSKSGLTGVAPANGEPLWAHEWEPKTRIVQPALTPEGDVLLSGGETTGLRRLAVTHSKQAWSAEERWTSFRLKPYFNDFVVHKGHAYGFDGRILAAIDLADGERRWKGGRYGQGQILLLADQDLLLVLSEEGELALVEAKPEAFREVARFAALEGKTWNHPVLVGRVLLVRNDQEMVAFRLEPNAQGTAKL